MPSPTRLLLAVLGALVCCLSCAHVALADEVQANRKGTVRPIAPGVAETLAEISDPAEIDRLVGLCQQSRSGSATAVFRNMLQQLSSDRKAAKSPGKSPKTDGGTHSVRQLLEEHDA